MKTIPVKVYGGGCIECLLEVDECSISRECTNHKTAGDFRSEGGCRPKFKNLKQGIVNIDGHENTIDCYSHNLPMNETRMGSCVLVEDLLEQRKIGDAVNIEFAEGKITNITENGYDVLVHIKS